MNMSDTVNDQDAFLRQEVESATPAKLRWLLLRKAIGLCQAVEQLWSDARHADANQWLLRVRDIFGELLDGVTDPQNPASKPTADLYSFLIIMLDGVEKGRDPVELRSMIEILEIEFGTWDLFVRRESQVGSLGGERGGHGQSLPAQCAGIVGFAESGEWASLNVEA
jgi:flagellar secretion chaperone FliS